jgi:hypothetical protein
MNAEACALYVDELPRLGDTEAAPAVAQRRGVLFDTGAPKTTIPETTAAVAKPQLGSRVASSSDRWILRRLKAPSRPGICPSRTESSRFRLTSVTALITP